MTWWFFQRKPRPASNRGQWQARWTFDAKYGPERRWAIEMRYFRGVDIEEWFNVTPEIAASMAELRMPVRLVELQR